MEERFPRHRNESGQPVPMVASLGRSIANEWVIAFEERELALRIGMPPSKRSGSPREPVPW